MVVKRGKLVRFVPTVETLVDTLREHYSAADADTLYAGRTWYDAANRFAQYLADEYGYSVAQTAYVVAALSPNVAWRDNMVTAENACRDHSQGLTWMGYQGAGYGANKAKCERILDGDLLALHGPKVERFAEAILGNAASCTVDIWMMRAAGFDHDNPHPREMSAIKAALAILADETGETVRDLQAIIWVQVRDASTGQARLWHRDERNAA